MSQERATEKQTTIKVPLNCYYFKINSLINNKNSNSNNNKTSNSDNKS